MLGSEPGIWMALLAIVYVVLRLWNLKRSRLKIMVHDLAAGWCLHCGAVHPEALKRPDPKGFWTEFKCPECGRSLSAHLLDK